MVIKVKKRKSLYGLWIFLSLLAIVITPLFAIAGVFYNSDTIEVKRNEEIDTDTYFSSLLGDCFENIEETGKISLSISEEDINGLLLSATDFFLTNKEETKLKSLANNDPILDTIEGFIHNLYFLIHEDHYQLSIEANIFNVYKTRLDLYFALDYEINYIDPTLGILSFEILDVVLGNVSLVDPILNYVPKQYLSNEMIEGFIKEAGLNIKVDLQNLKMTYQLKDIISDVKDMIGVDEDPQMKSMFSLIDEFIHFNVLNFSFNENKEITMALDLNSFATNEQFSTPEKKETKITESLPSYIDKMEQMINKENPLEDAYHSIAYKFLIRGYLGLTDEEKSIIDDLQEHFTSIGILDVKTYKPALYECLENKDNGFNELFDSIDNDTLLSGKVAHVDEDKINDVLSGTSIIGFNYLIKNQNPDGTYYLTHVTVDNFYLNIVDNHLYVTAGLNINGFETCLPLIFHLMPSQSEICELKLYVETVYLGEHVTGEEMENLLYPMINESFKNTGITTFDIETGVLTITFESYVQDIMQNIGNDIIAGNFHDYATIDIELIGTLHDKGYMDITWELK